MFSPGDSALSSMPIKFCSFSSPSENGDVDMSYLLSTNATLATMSHPYSERARKPRSFNPDSYPHFTNGGEKPGEPPQEAFAKRASLSRWFAIQQGHHGSAPDSHPGVLPPSRKGLPSWSQASDPSAGPTPQA